MDFITKKLYGLDFLRKTAHEDKERSRTRLAFTLFLIICAALGFAGFFAYKALTRGSVLQNLKPNKGTTVDYSDWKKISDNPDLSSTLTCTTTKGVYFGVVAIYLAEPNVTFDDSKSIVETKIYDLCDGYFSNYVYKYGCQEGSYSFVEIMESTKIIQGSLYDEEELANLYDDLVETVYFQTYESHYSAWAIAARLVTNITDDNIISGNVSSLDTFNDQLSDSINGGDFDDAVFNGTFAASLEYDLDHPTYYALAQVTECTYFEKEGWLDVFNFALNSTQAFFAVFLFIVGLAYGLVKTYQRKMKQKEKKEKSADLEMTKTEEKKEEKDGKKEEKKEKKKEKKEKGDKDDSGSEEGSDISGTLF